MLSIQQARQARVEDAPRIGLALAGGGPLGLIYEVGAIRALDECLEGLDLQALHVYVGVSSGAVVAATLAAGVSSAQMCRLYIGEASEGGVDPAIFLRPALEEYARRLARLPGLGADALARVLREPGHGLMETLAILGPALPAGVFDNAAIGRFFATFLAAPGRCDDFRRLGRRLYLVAVELDTGASVRFGGPGYDHVPISRAIQASTALPGLYPPVDIDGRYYVDGALKKTLHASVAFQAGAGVVLCINPLVPFDANQAARHGVARGGSLAEGGAPVVLAQTFRALIHSRMRAGMARYTHRYPDRDLVLFEPDRHDASLFFTNVFSFANRRRVCENAYQTTRRDLLARRRALEPVLRRHGIRFRLDVLRDPCRRFDTGIAGIGGTDRSLAGTLGRLAGALDTLQDLLESGDRRPPEPDAETGTAHATKEHPP